MNTKELCEQLTASTAANLREWIIQRLEQDILDAKIRGDAETIVQLCFDCYFRGVTDSFEHWFEHMRNLNNG